MCTWSVCLNNWVDVTDEGECRIEASESKYQKEGIRNNGHIAKVETTLDYSFHTWTIEEVEKRISIDKSSSGAATK